MKKSNSTLILLLLLLISNTSGFTQTNSIIKLAHFKVVADGSETYEYTEYYNKNGQLDSVYRRPNWADSTFAELMSEQYGYLSNGKINYIMHYDTDDIIGQLFFVKNYIYENDSISQEHRLDSLCSNVNVIEVYGNGNILEFVGRDSSFDNTYLNHDYYEYVTYHWKYQKYNNSNQLIEAIDLTNNNFKINYAYNNKGLMKKMSYSNPKTSFSDKTDDKPKIYTYQYIYAKNNEWIVRKQFDEEEVVTQTTYRTIKYY